MSTNELRYGPLGTGCAHVCVDMQNMFLEDTGWRAPWMERVRPVVRRLAEARADRTVFTRFVPPRSVGEVHGTWRRYYERWEEMTLDRLEPRMVELLPELAALVPPARVVNKATYSPFLYPEMSAVLRDWRVDTVVVSGTETDVCVLGAVLHAVDLGFRVVVATDALCSSSDRTHDALLTLYDERFGQQIETASTDTILQAW